MSWLARHGVSGGVSGISEVLEGWVTDCSSPGPGLTQSFTNKFELMPFCFTDSDTHVSVAMVKEEVAKKTKIDAGDYRFIFNFPCAAAVQHKMLSVEFNNSLKNTGLMYADDSRITIPKTYSTMESAVRSGGVAWNCDTSKHDRSVPSCLTRMVYRVRSYFNGFEYPQSLVKQTVKPYFYAYDDNGNFVGVQATGGVLSGHPNTSSDNTVIMLFMWYLFARRRDLLDGKIIGYGDNIDVVFPRFVPKKDFEEFFQLAHMKIKVNSVFEHSDFDSMGASLALADGVCQPYWNLLKSVVSLSYVEKKSASEFGELMDVLLRAAGVAQYCYYHPIFSKFEEFFLELWTLLSPLEKSVVEGVWESGRVFYSRAEASDPRGGFLKMFKRDTESLKAELLRRGVLPSSLDYALMAVDPFHDTPLNICPAPSSEDGKAVVYDVRKDFQLGNSSAGGLWDAHVAWVPRGTLSLTTSSYTNRATFTSSIGAAGGSVGAVVAGGCSNTGAAHMPLIVAINNNTGGNMFNPNADATGVANLLVCDVDDVLPEDGSPIRFIGGAIEVHNTTPELYRGGTITTYKQKFVPSEQTMVAVNSAQTSPPFQVEMFPTPPCSEAEARQLGGISWEAGKGALIPIPLDVDSFRSRRWTNGYVVHVPSSTDTSTTGPYRCYADTILGTFVNGSSSAPIPAAQSFMNYGSNQVGAILTGLNPQATFTISVRLFFEAYPRPGSSMYPLAAPTPPYDGALVQALAGMFSEMQPAYPVGMNARGGFFRSVLAGLRSVPAILSGLEASPDPRLKALGIAASSLDDMLPRAKAKRAVEQASNRVNEVQAQRGAVLDKFGNPWSPASKADKKKKKKKKVPPQQK